MAAPREGVARWLRREPSSTRSRPRPPSASRPARWTGFLDLGACVLSNRRGFYRRARVTIFVCAPRRVGFCCPSPSCACFFLSFSRSLSPVAGSFSSREGCWRGMRLYLCLPPSPGRSLFLGVAGFFAPTLKCESKHSVFFPVPATQPAFVGVLGGLARASRALLSDACGGDIYEGYKCMLLKGTFFPFAKIVFPGGRFPVGVLLCCAKPCYSFRLLVPLPEFPLHVGFSGLP